jgi:hypothetical protein
MAISHQQQSLSRVGEVGFEKDEGRGFTSAKSLFGQFDKFLDSPISSCCDQDRESTFLVNEGAAFCEMPDSPHQEQPEVSQSSSTSVYFEDPIAFATLENNNFFFENMVGYPSGAYMVLESTDNPDFDMTEILSNFPTSVYFHFSFFAQDSKYLEVFRS